MFSKKFTLLGSIKDRKYKNMHLEESYEVENICCNCFDFGDLRCSRCKTAVYCSKECQLADWRTSHKFVCHNNDDNEEVPISSIQKCYIFIL